MANMVNIDGNTAAAHVAHAINEVVAIYPITPSSNMGEMADAKSANGEINIYGTVPKVVELQSEGGASGAVHGALQGGALTTTFTASQGLLLMIPNMFKIAGELTPTVFHVSARSIACQALSIFGDHSDVMACRSTGWSMLASNNPQEVMDFALIAQAASLKTRVPFLHFFEGFRTSHEVQKVAELSKDDMAALIDDEAVKAHRERALSPDRPVLRGTAQNPDVYFQGRETVTPYYQDMAAVVQEQMDKLAQRTGRQYKVMEYIGAPDAERVVVIMGSGADTVRELVEYLSSQGEKVGVLKVRLFQPFDTDRFIQALPDTVKKIAVLDRTKEPGSLGEPMYHNVRTAIGEAMAEGKTAFTSYPKVVGGRYGLGSYEFSPAMVNAVFDNLGQDNPKNHFTVGIEDDVSHTSLNYDPNYRVPAEGVYQAMFYGLGSDGTVGANKNSIKIIGETTDNEVQAYFVYDSKKAGSMTVSHLRFGKDRIRSPYLIDSADFLACHNFSFLEKYDMLKNAKQGATFLLNSPYDKDDVWDQLPQEVQQQIIDKDLKVYVINGVRLGEEIGLGPRINVIMQTAFFKISNIIPLDKAIAEIKDAIVKTYGKAGEKVVNMNKTAVDQALEELYEVPVPKQAQSDIHIKPAVGHDAPEFVKRTTAPIIEGKGGKLPTSAMPADGTFPTGTSKFEKRNIAVNIPVWDPELCVQCGICSFVCPHAVIRMKIYDPEHLKGAPANFKATDARGKGLEGKKFSLQVAPEDCTGCGACVHNCPAKSKENPKHKAINMQFQPPLREQEKENWEFFLHQLLDTEESLFDRKTLKGSQLLPPMFEFSGACPGCGETPFVKLLTQLFGDRALISNATGCSSIYGGNLPTTPYTTRKDGLGPTWNNSLFEDNAEFGYGMRLAVDKFNQYALELLDELMGCGCKECTQNKDLFAAIKKADQSTQQGIEEQRQRIAEMKNVLAGCTEPAAQKLLQVADYLVKKSVWMLGGDGWAYDIGYGGLDHVLASGENVNALVLDTEVYSNTGGQASKATPIGAVAKFANAGMRTGKKNMGLMMISYGYVYVASVAMGANRNQCMKAFVEAEAYPGPSIILAYSPCINHGIDMMEAQIEEKRAVDCGYWPLYRYNPAAEKRFSWDSRDPKGDFQEFLRGERRYTTLYKTAPEEADRLFKEAEEDALERFQTFKNIGELL